MHFLLNSQRRDTLEICHFLNGVKVEILVIEKSMNSMALVSSSLILHAHSGVIVEAEN